MSKATNDLLSLDLESQAEGFEPTQKIPSRISSMVRHEPKEVKSENLLYNQKKRESSLRKADATVFEDARLTNRMLKTSKLINESLMAFGVLCISISLITKELEISEREQRKNHPDIHKSSISPVLTTWLGVGVSILMSILILLRKSLMHKLAFHRREKQSNDKGFWSAKLVVQCLLILMCPVPFFNGQYFVTFNQVVNKEIQYEFNDMLHMAQFFKTYYIFKYLIQESNFASNSSHRLCALYDVRHNNTLVIKCMMKETPLKFVTVTFLIGIFIFGYAIRLAELPLAFVESRSDAIDLSNYFSCCWTAVLTMTTVGYGEFYPRTTLGRLVTVICCLYGMVIVSLMVNFITQELQLTATQNRAFTSVQKLFKKDEIKDQFALILKKAGKFKVLKNRGDEAAKDRAKILYDIIGEQKKLSDRRLEYKGIQTVTGREAVLRSLDLLKGEVKELRTLMTTMTKDIDLFTKCK